MSYKPFGETDQNFVRRLVEAGIDIECAYDIGASNGLWSWQIAQAVPHARFELFEPNDSEQYAKELAQVLKGRPDFRMHRVALGNQDTTLRLNLHENHDGASLIDSDWEGVLSKMPVPVRRLDSIVAYSWRAIYAHLTTFPPPDILLQPRAEET